MPTETPPNAMGNMTRAEIEIVVKFIKALNIALHRRTGRTVTFLPGELPVEININDLNISDEEDTMEVENAKD